MSRGSTFPPTVPPETGAGGAARRPLLDRLIARDQAIVAACLAAAIALAWFWLASAPPGGHGAAGADSGMAMAAMPRPAWSAAYLFTAFAMWALMMVAMMLPSAAPMILLYSRFAQRSAPRPLAYTGTFVLAYVVVWTVFSAAAASAQALLVSAGAVSATTLAVGDGRLAGVLLVLAGLYQLSPLKQACLDQCRSPLSFIMRLSRPGALGALRLGLAHGFYCLGCCWALMALLFVGGAMNPAWIAGLALLVIAEKLAPGRLLVSRLLAGGLILGGLLWLALSGLSA